MVKQGLIPTTTQLWVRDEIRKTWVWQIGTPVCAHQRGASFNFGPTTLSSFRRYLWGWVLANTLTPTHRDICENMIGWWGPKSKTNKNKVDFPSTLVVFHFAVRVMVRVRYQRRRHRRSPGWGLPPRPKITYSIHFWTFAPEVSTKTSNVLSYSLLIIPKTLKKITHTCFMFLTQLCLYSTHTWNTCRKRLFTNHFTYAIVLIFNACVEYMPQTSVYKSL